MTSASPPAIPLTARAAVLKAWGTPYVIDPSFPVPQPGSLKRGECLIKLEYSGVCHSDLHIMKDEWGRSPALPLVGGHEGIGVVVAVGGDADLEQEEVKVGDRVGIKWIAGTCLRCENCRKGNESACPVSFQKVHGYRQQGSFAQYVVSYSNYVTPIPEGLDSALAAPILCAGLTVYKALKQARVQIGDWVAISGAGGGLGHLAVQYAVAMGLRVLAIDTGEKKKELAVRLGAERWVDFMQSNDLVKDVQAAADGLGPHAAIIAAGSALPFNQAVNYLRSTGTLIAIGVPGGGATLSIPIPLLIGKNLHIVGTSIGSRQDAIEALRIAAQGKVKCQIEIRDLSELNQVFEDLEAGKIAGRVVVKV